MEIETIQFEDISKKNGKLTPFKKGSKGNRNEIGVIDLTTRLRNLLLDTLMEKDGAGIEVVVNAIRQCISNKPEQILSLATRLLPKDIHVNGDKIAFAPLVVVQNTNIQVNNDFNKETAEETKQKTQISINQMDEKKQTQIVDAIAFSKPVLIPDIIETEKIGSFTKEDFINASNVN